MKKTLILIITIFLNYLSFSQSKVDTVIIVLDSLYFQKYVICEDINKTRCTDTIYSLLTFENIKNGFLSYIDNDINNKIGKKLELNQFKEKQKYFESTYTCKGSYKGFEFPLHSTLYLKLMYINSNCDSIPILEGKFFQNQKYEFYYSGLYKEFDKKGQIKIKGYYYFTKEGERSVSIPRKG